MKVRILTAHGYLSFQPPLGGDPNGIATLQYRPTAGAWEECEVTGWDVQQVPVAPPDSGGGTTPEGDWLGIPPSKSVEYVAAIKANLESRGVNLSGPCGAYQVVENVAWGLRHSGIGTFFKDGGNNCAQRSTDIVSFKDLSYGCARIVDILGDSGGLNTPMWGERSEPEDINRWMPAEHPDAVNELTGTRSTSRRRSGGPEYLR